VGGGPVKHGNRVAPILAVAIHIGHDRAEQAVRVSANLVGSPVINAQGNERPLNRCQGPPIDKRAEQAAIDKMIESGFHPGEVKGQETHDQILTVTIVWARGGGGAAHSCKLRKLVHQPRVEGLLLGRIIVNE
jgi:hypothetical protein